MMDIDELADRVEALAGPDREIDAAIFAALKLGTRDWMHQSPQAERMWARQYTKSIDAAMMLVATGHDWMLDTFDGKFTGRRCSASVWVSKERWIDASGATPALALTAAALRTKALGAVHTLTEGN